MRKLIKKFLWVVALIITLPSAWAFSLSGPIGNADDAWQIILLAYGYNDSVAPKDIFEEYRPVVPVQYYASDSSFISYYGTSGLTNIDAAFGILNGVMSGQTNTPVFLSSPTNGITMDAYGQPGGMPLTLGVSNSLDSYSSDLSDFPFESEQQNYTAQTLGLYDMKSQVLHEVLLELGLADPERYVWTLHDREFTPGLKNPKCPQDEEYLVVQRNFDVTQDYPYSSYINNSLYTFYIAENCGKGGVPYSAITEPVPADPFNQNLAVAAGGLLSGSLGAGGFYTGLTRDDVMALKYLLSTNNVNWEATAPSGSLLLVTNIQQPQTLTTFPISQLWSQAATNDPSTLLTNYPGLVLLSVITNIGPQVVTNIAPYFTNQSVSPVYTNYVKNGLTNGLYFTNQPGPTTINYDITQPFSIISTLDLATFSDLSRTSSPVAMQALYPGLQILRATTFPSYVPVTNYVYYLTNKTGAPYQGPPKAVTKVVSINYVWITNWVYTFGNVLTNHYYTNRLMQSQSIWVKSPAGAPYGTLVITTNYATYKTNLVSGDFFIIPTNWCGFDVAETLPLSTPPYSYGTTNTIFYNGYNTNGATGTNVVAGGNSYGLVQNYYDLYTNRNYAVYPGICEPVLVIGTNYTTNVVTTYQYYFGGIVTNQLYTNTTSVVLTTNVEAYPGGSPDLLSTNISIVTNIINQPSGDFYTVPPAWCGYTVISNLLTNTLYVTNFVSATNVAGVTNISQYYSQTTITAYKTTTLLVQPIICSQATPVANLRRGIGRVQFIRANYDSLLGQFFQPLTNTYSMTVITNSQSVTEYYQRVVTKPDLLFKAQDLTVVTTAKPYGEDYTISTPNFDTSAIITGLAGPGTIVPGVTMVFNKNANDLYLNGSLAEYNYSTNAFLNLDTQTSLGAFGSFDGSTNYPVIYPSGASIVSLMNQIIIQITPATAPDGTNGTPYNVTFSATGGQPPYVWTAPNISTLVPGLSFNAATATVSGTPSASGTFTFTLQLTDSANRVVNLNYPITIH